MKAVVNYARGAGNVELRDVPEPAVGPGDVKVAVKAAGICGTDIHIYDGEYDNRPPVILGHEVSGEIVEIGPGVSGWNVGDRVTGQPIATSCGLCRYCKTGMLPLCTGRRGFGTRRDGAFAKYLVIPAHIAHRLPDDLDFNTGALTEPLACCVKAVNEMTPIQAGDLVLVTGPGAIGLIASQLAKARGAKVIIVGTAADRPRLELALKLGIDHALDLEAGKVESTVAELTGGNGVDIMVECSGAPAAVRSALRLLRAGGQLTQMGMFGGPFELDYGQIPYRDIRVIGSFSFSLTSFDRALVLLYNKAIQLAPLVSTVLPLSEWKRGFQMVRDRQAMRILLRPDED